MAWESKIPRITSTAPARFNRAVDQAGQYGQAVARAHARVRTGYMRDHIIWDSYERELRGEAYWTIFNELGTRYMSAQPMFAPAMLAMEESIERGLRLVFK